jgi:hypothetical protein
MQCFLPRVTVEGRQGRQPVVPEVEPGEAGQPEEEVGRQPLQAVILGGDPDTCQQRKSHLVQPAKGLALLDLMGVVNLIP